MLISESSPINQIINTEYTKSFIKKFGSSSKTFRAGYASIFNLVTISDKKFPLFENLYSNLSESLKNYDKNPVRMIITTQIYYTLILKNLVQIIVKNHNQNIIDNVINLFDEITSFDSIIESCLEQNELWIKNALDLLNEYAPNNRFLSEIQITDFFQVFYLGLFPRKLRKSLGEVYTPYWLAKHIVNESSWLKQNSNSYILDPSCGSGSFIKAFISKILHKQLTNNTNKLEFITKHVSGFDINPIAVFTSKINFLLQIINILPKNQKLSIPIYVKNVFVDSPPKKPKYDYIIGNPPWINWENITEIEKRGLSNLFENWNTDKVPNLNKTLGYAKQDISGIFFLFVAENYLKNGGKIIFLVNKALINGKANSNFRKQFFKAKYETNVQKSLDIVQIEDLSELQPFKNIKTSTVIIHAQKGRSTNLEIPFKIWRVNLKDKTLKKLTQKQDNIVMEDAIAKFIEYDTNSNLITTKVEKYLNSKIAYNQEKKTYIAKEGANTEGLNSAYWITNIKSLKENLITFDNYNRRQKNKTVLKDKIPIERDLVFPLIRSGNLKKWKYAIDTYLIFTAKYSDNEIRDESQFKKLYPFTYNYFALIEQDLRNRKSYQGKSKNLPFYIMYGHTDMIDGYKVCWNRIGSSIDAVVIENYNDQLIGNKQPVPQETIVYINTGDNSAEAHFLCAILNSQLFNKFISELKISGSKSFGTPDILNYIIIPTFDSNDVLHKQLSGLSTKIHEAVKKEEEIKPHESRINDLVTKILL
ncbi:MAG: N-6 DNA methylase [Candidatus Hodarchaeales archaeon]|jgi:methylase of polypeptide subunit release factors